MPGQSQKEPFSGRACPPSPTTGPPTPSPIGQRVAIVGCSGSGKSQLARRIARARGVDYINADELLWKPGWDERTKPEYYALLEQHMAADAWVFDGNIGGSAKVVVPRIDTLIWLDYPRPMVMRRLLGRTIRRAWTKQVIFAGNAESWRRSFASKNSILLYAWRSHGQRRADYEALWPTLDPSIRAHRPASQAQLDTLLHQAGIQS